MFIFNVGGKELYAHLAQGCCYNISVGPGSAVGKKAEKNNFAVSPPFSFSLTAVPGPRLL